MELHKKYDSRAASSKSVSLRSWVRALATGWVEFDPEQEVRGDEDRLQSELETGVGPFAVGHCGLDEPHQPVHLGVRNGPAVRPVGERLEGVVGAVDLGRPRRRLLVRLGGFP